LTLKSVFFTYQHSKKGAFNPYWFNYEGTNQKYEPHTSDRWGNYKANATDLTNAEYPYSVQDTSTANKNIATWALSSIQLPTGGILKVKYESDDYAYVQDRRAMQMFKVKGMAKSSNATSYTNELYDGSSTHIDYLFFDIPNDPVYLSQYNADPTRFKNMLFGDESLFYFKFHINVRKNNADDKEYVPGYFTIDKQSVGINKLPNNTLVGYFKINPISLTGGIGTNEVNPITRAAVQFTRIHLPNELSNTPKISETGVLDVLKKLFGLEDVQTLFTNINNLVNGENKVMVDAGAGRVFDTDGKSFVRLYSPVGRKLGGGHRVARVEIKDNWAQMTSEDSFSYGQEYIYTTKDADNKTEISSGVAAYEPQIGGEENPYRQPIFYKVENILAPSETYYHEEPFGESFFPAPTVGYSKVTVRNIQHANVKSNATGFIVNEFYTAKDFPTITQRTSVDEDRVRPLSISSQFTISQDDYMTATQGYYVELNDMHGKGKAVYVYPEGGSSFVSSTEYRYKQGLEMVSTEVGGQQIQYQINRLKNDVSVLEKDVTNNSHQFTKTVGVDYDVVYDFRRTESQLTSAGVGVNLDFFVLGIIPVLVPAVLPKFDHEATQFNSGVVTKVVRRSGVLESVSQNDQGSIITTYNEAYDPNTGDVIMTKTFNQYDDPVYDFKYPAYWAYEGMGGAYQNIGRTFGTIDFSNTPTGVFNIGDQLLVKTSSDIMKKATIVEVISPSSFKVALNDEDGTITSAKYAKIIRSGKKNQLMDVMGSVSSLSAPVIDRQISFNNVLHASMVTYKNDWARYCECDNSGGVNPLIRTGNKVFHPVASYAYITERKLTRLNGNTNLKNDGVYADFMPFWVYSAQNKWDAESGGKWRYTNAVTIRNGHGEELENVDYLGRYSSATFGYAQIFPTAVASNTPYNGLAFDNFESYEVENCEDNHFNFKKAIAPTTADNAVPSTYQSANTYTNRSSGITITDSDAHTGRYSIMVPSGQSASITKNLTSCPPIVPEPPREVVVK